MSLNQPLEKVPEEFSNDFILGEFRVATGGEWYFNTLAQKPIQCFGSHVLPTQILVSASGPIFCLECGSVLTNNHYLCRDCIALDKNRANLDLEF